MTSTGKDDVTRLVSTDDNVSTPTSTDKDKVSTIDSTDKDSVSMTNALKSDALAAGITPTDDKMMASFRIDRELWVKFGKLVKSERLTATDVLTDYIQRCTDNDKSQYAVNTSTDEALSTGTYDDTRLNDAVMTAIGTLSLPDRDAVMMMVSTAIEASLQSSVRVMIESALEPITEQVTLVESFTRSQLQTVRDDLKKL
jgi:hypothetical protein